MGIWHRVWFHTGDAGIAANMSRVQLDHVSKIWDTRAAVDEVSITAPTGSFVALLGPSGCGKSTTLRLVAGLETPTSGRVLIGDRDVTLVPPAQRGLSMVFQSYALFPHLTVAENIIFGLKVRRVRPAERERRLARAAEMLGLTEYLDRRPAALSGGQRQRIALGRAIVAEAPVCLMDEPLSNLDAQLRQQMRSEIRALQQRLGMTMIYVTHDQVEAMTMADHVVLMNQGRVEQQGVPAELYEHPASVFAASFIGAPAMNLFAPGTLPHGLDAPEATLGVRPEQIQLDEPGKGLPAQVQAVEYLGAETLIICTVRDTRITSRRPGRVPVRPGEAVSLAWAAADQHFFDPTSGRRLSEATHPAAATPAGSSPLLQPHSLIS